VCGSTPDIPPQELTDRSANVPSERTSFCQANQLGIGITPNGNLSLRLGKPDPSLGVDPEISLAAELTPDQARQLAAALVRKAAEAEAAEQPRRMI
jgi:hypothetical protein